MAGIVFMALHGENGENGKIQAAFDLFGIRYTGTGYLGSALAMNKGMAKQLFLENGIPTPRGTSLKRGEDAAKIETCGIHFPCVVKPCSGGSSIGVSIVHDKAEYEQALKEAFRWENELVIEEYVKGREFSVGVIVTVLSVLSMKRHKHDVRHPAKLDDIRSEEIIRLILSALFSIP